MTYSAPFWSSSRIWDSCWSIYLLSFYQVTLHKLHRSLKTAAMLKNLFNSLFSTHHPHQTLILCSTSFLQNLFDCPLTTKINCSLIFQPLDFVLPSADSTDQLFLDCPPPGTKTFFPIAFIVSNFQVLLWRRDRHFICDPWHPQNFTEEWRKTCC